MPDELRYRTYDDQALPIGAEQAISQPLIVAVMLEVLALKPMDRALEVGTGWEYESALLSNLAGEVVTVERVTVLRSARTR